MFITYYDESGDDGFPKYSSLLFVLSSLYLEYHQWQENYERIHQFRNRLKQQYKIPLKLEMHSKHFLLNKIPYRKYKISDADRIKIIDSLCKLISQLQVNIVNVVINKTAIKRSDYKVLDRALTYSIQRIENHLKRIDPLTKFMIVTDEGRVGKMRKTARKIQRINFIPSRYGSYSYRHEIRSLLEDPLPKSSKESYFVQLVDLVAYIVYLYSTQKLGVGHFPNRMPDQVNHAKVIDWMDKLKGSLNIEASNRDEYEVVCYPK